MRRVIIGLAAVMLAAPALAQPSSDPDGVRLLGAAIAAARDKGAVGFRLRCAFGCSRPRTTLARLSINDVMESREIPCKRPERTCYSLDLERRTPITLWYAVHIETRADPAREIARVEISGP